MQVRCYIIGGVIITLSNFVLIEDVDAGLSQPPIITREQRGADESLRWGNPPLPRTSTHDKGADDIIVTTEQKRAAADEYLVTNFPQEFRIDDTIRTWNGRRIMRPIQINNRKSKIVIHHTARSPMTNSYEDVIAELQDIYEFHTLKRRRGDIGYNYIIGPNGEIFEGRAGGPSAVAAHAINNNGGSIGISLMGNFNNIQPSAAQLRSTIELTAWLAQKYNINVYDQISYHEASKVYPYIIDHIDDSLVGHTDAGDTSCPGTNLYNKLDTIKSQVNELIGVPTPSDPTPIITDPVRYYIPSTSYQLSIPWTTTSTIISCTTNSTIWNISKCGLSGGSLTLNLSKLINQAHQGNLKVTITTDQGQYYLYLSLEYKPSQITLSKTLSIPTNSAFKSISKVNILLYDLSTSQNMRNVYCQQGCTITLNQHVVALPAKSSFMLSTVPKDKTLYFWRNNQKYLISSITVTPTANYTVSIPSYKRSQGDTLLNERQGSLTRSLQDYKPIGNPTTSGIVITNLIRKDDYMRGLLMSSPDTPRSYHDTMYLIANTNLYNRGSNITDDVRIHQYYAGANAKILDYKRGLSHDIYSTSVLIQGTNLTLAPWFECSDGITRNGIVDLGICEDGKLSGPGLGLSRKGALMLSQRGYSTSQIIEYYYPGVQITRDFTQL